jgi:hypothetical protein
MYNPYIFKNKKDSLVKPIIGNITYCNLNEAAIYATSDNKLHVIHPIYTIKDRISTLELPLEKYISDGAIIKSYSEYFIHYSSISLFSNSYYAILSYLESLKEPLNKRT